MGILSKIITGSPGAKSRFHTLDGERVDLAGMRYLPNSMLSTVGRHLFGVRSRIPWLGYRAIRRLEKLLQPTWEMIEYGSGMSTVWFSQRVKHVYSIESNPQWFSKVQADFQRMGVENVTYKLCQGLDYAEAAHVADNSIDFILVDGVMRHPCMHTALKKVKPNGWIYLDNADKPGSDPPGDITQAEQVLVDYANQHGTPIETFIDFIPTNFFVTKGLLVQIKK